MNIEKLIKIIIAFSFILIGCSDENQNESDYKKQTDVPLTGQSINKKTNPSKKVSDFY